jgi:hypothetical protein
MKLIHLNPLHVLMVCFISFFLFISNIHFILENSSDDNYLEYVSELEKPYDTSNIDYNG